MSRQANMHPNQRIALLAAQLPRQRRSLVTQSAAVGQAVSRAVTSPMALTLVAVSGAVLGWRWCRHPAKADDGSPADPAALADGWRARLQTIVMAYLVRSLV